MWTRKLIAIILIYTRSEVWSCFKLNAGEAATTTNHDVGDMNSLIQCIANSFLFRGRLRNRKYKGRLSTALLLVSIESDSELMDSSHSCQVQQH